MAARCETIQPGSEVQIVAQGDGAATALEVLVVAVGGSLREVGEVVFVEQVLDACGHLPLGQLVTQGQVHQLIGGEVLVVFEVLVEVVAGLQLGVELADPDRQKVIWKKMTIMCVLD